MKIEYREDGITKSGSSLRRNPSYDIIEKARENMCNSHIGKIINCIEGTPEISIHRVRPGDMPDEITGMNKDYCKC